LTPLEIGLHALGATERYGRNGGGMRAYAEAIGKSNGYLTQITQAVSVYAQLRAESFSQLKLLSDKAQHLATIHKASQAAWLPLAQQLIANSWSVQETEQAIDRVKVLLDAIPTWWSIDTAPLIELALRGEAQAAMKMFAQATEIDAKLRTVTIYSHEDSGEIENRDCRARLSFRSRPSCSASRSPSSTCG